MKMSALLTGIKVVTLILVYFSFSIGLTFYQKWFIGTFKFPITIVMFHLIFKFIFASLYRLAYELYTKESRITLKWKEYVKRISLIGIFCALDIGLSNWSFEFITVSLYTMSKSTSIIFILMFSILLKLEKMRSSLVLVVILIAGGLFLFTYHSTQFNLVGFIMVMSASFISGLRWTMSQLVMQKNDIGLGNPVDMVYHVQPFMVLSLIPLFIGFEGLAISESVLFRFEKFSAMMHTFMYILFGSSLAFLMELSEYMLLLQTSSLTLSISGIVKEIFTLILAVEINHDRFSNTNVVGLTLCLFGIISHVIIKTRTSDETVANIDGFEMKELLPNAEDSDENELFNLTTVKKK